MFFIVVVDVVGVCGVCHCDVVCVIVVFFVVCCCDFCVGVCVTTLRTSTGTPGYEDCSKSEAGMVSCARTSGDSVAGG